MTKVSVIRFKPKPECFDEFLNNIKERDIDNSKYYAADTLLDDYS